MSRNSADSRLRTVRGNALGSASRPGDVHSIDRLAIERWLDEGGHEAPEPRSRPSASSSTYGRVDVPASGQEARD
jgi:hypothetical protein